MGDQTYRSAKVGRSQEAEEIYVQDDGYFAFYTGDESFRISGAELKGALYARAQNTIIINSVGALSVTTIPSLQGLVVFSITDAASNASAWLPSCNIGQEMTLMTRGGGSIGSVLVSTLSGVTVIGLLSGGVSTIMMHQSAASHAIVKLLATDTDEWSVVGVSGQVTLQADA